MYARTLGCPRPGLGAAAAVLALAPVLNTVLSTLGLSSSDPVKDQLRITRINDTFNAAMAGGTAIGADGQSMPAATCLQQMAQSSGGATGCGVGSKVAVAYAKVKWIEYQARVAAGTIGSGLVAQSNIPTTITGTIGRVASNPLLLAALAVGGFLLFSRKGRG